MKILMRDFNAKIGADNTVYNKVTGQLKQNGKRFAHRCCLNQLVIGGSIFSHKRIHKAARRFPEQVIEIRWTIFHQQEISKSMERWGADISSDHHQLMMTERLFLKKFNNTTNRTRYKASVYKSKWGHHSTSVCPTESSCFKTSHKTTDLSSRHNGNILRKYDKSHARNSSTNDRLNTKSGSRLIPWRNLK